MIAATKGLKSVMENAWPRIHVHRGEIVRGLSFSWIRCCEDDKGVAEELKTELKDAAEMLDFVLKAEGIEAWEGEKKELVITDGRLNALLPQSNRADV